MKEEYIFPHNNWYLEITDENIDVINDWRINIVKYSNDPCKYKYINWEGQVDSGGLLRLVCITFEQFQEYVLNIPYNNNSNNNYDSLINLLTKYCINE